MENKALIYDCETTTIRSFNKLANPLDPRNYVVAYAFKTSMSRQEVDFEYGQPVSWVKLKEALMSHNTIIGHNIKFDLLYLWKYDWFQDWLKTGGKIYDTMVSEYLLSGQQLSLKRGKECSLRSLAVKHGQPEREKVMEYYWEQGRCTSTIPEELVIKDVTNDIKDTEALYISQIKRLEQMGSCVDRYNFSNLFSCYMESILATIEMEFNGIKINTDRAKNDKELLESQLNTIESSLINFVDEHICEWPLKNKFNPASNQHVSLVLFGGNIDAETINPIFDENDQIVKFKTGLKTGQTKYKKEIISCQITGLRARTTLQNETKNEGYYSVSDQVLQSLLTNNKAKVKEFVSWIIKRREIATLLDRYYEGMVNLVTPWDECVHTEYQHNLTETGRLSSRNPNLQNIPR